MKEKFFKAASLLLRKWPQDVEEVFAAYGLNGVRNMILRVNSYDKKVSLLPKAARIFRLYSAPRKYNFLQYMADNGEEIYREYPQGYKMLCEIAMFCCKRALLCALWQKYPQKYSSSMFGLAEWNFYKANAINCLDIEDTLYIARKVCENSTLAGEPKNGLCWKRRLDAPPSLLEVREFCMGMLQH